MRDRKRRSLTGNMGGTLAVADLVTDLISSTIPAAALARKASNTAKWILKRARDRREQDVALLMQELLWQVGDDAAIAVEIEARIRASEEVQDAVLAQVRRVLEGVDRRVVPALALIARPVIQGSAKADAFFRGFSRVLADLSADEYDILRDMMHTCMNSFVSPEPIWLGVDETRQAILTARQPGDPDHSEASRSREIMPGLWREAKRLTLLLTSNGIATPQTEVERKHSVGLFAISIDYGVAARMAACMVR